MYNITLGLKFVLRQPVSGIVI